MAVYSQRSTRFFFVAAALVMVFAFDAASVVLLARATVPALQRTALVKAAAPSLDSASSTQLALQWRPFGSTSRYRVRYSKHSSMKKSTYKRVNTNAILVSGLKAATKYYVRVQAIKTDSSGTPLSAYSAKKSFKTAKKLKYTAPKGLSAKPSAGGADRVALNWAFVKPGLNYQVQHSPRPNLSQSRSVRVRAASAAITGLARSTRHYFRVRVVGSSGVAASSWSKLVSVATRSPADPAARPLNLATYNVRNGTVATDTGNKAWKVRRSLVANSIKAQRLDVVGLQEAVYTAVTGADGSPKHQYQDLVEILGGAWKITCSTPENLFCDRSSNYSSGTRIIYNSTTVGLVEAGVKELSIRSGDVRRFMAWSVFTQKSTGRSFFFADAHLDDAKTTAGYQARITQTKQILAEISAQNSQGLPVILVGDLNSHKWRSPDNAPYKLLATAGLVDPIGNPDFSRVAIKPTTEVRIRTEFDSWNGFAAAPDQHGWINGINVDYVWVAKSVHTLEYETVVNINDATLKFAGPAPSDHNMIRATVLIPK